MILEKERKEIADYLKKMLESGLTKGTSGNISIFDRKNGYIAISPSGMNYEEIIPEDVVVIDLDKNIIEGNRKPSSESDLHIAIYKSKPEANSVVHTHSMFCTVLSTLNMPIKSVHYVIADCGSAEVPVAPYRIYGSEDLAISVVNTIGKSNACLLANHGMVACGDNLKSAFGLASTCEWVAEIQWRALSVGTPNYLSDNQIIEVEEKFKTYGQNSELNEKNSYFG
ncbi:class II aldolase/adducin family protein [Helcococcus sueciensis]|uniref:class II aldolase/adducin family protein n=1 Tax=Helcococcus sueciensis TaxID=241555 RepID=UPI0004255148|nr:class II aldolase/adducin family protein [Helcococcus sueciensis]